MDFLTVLTTGLLVGLSEFGDKTFIALFFLAGNARKPFPLWLGAMLGYLVLGTLAVSIGRSIVLLVPRQTLTLIAGAVFILLGLWMWFGKEDEEDAKKVRTQRTLFLTGFLLVLTAEFADKSQFAMAALAARFATFWPILLGALLGVGIVDGLAIVFGNFLRNKTQLPSQSAFWKKGAALLFIGLGVLSILSVLFA